MRSTVFAVGLVVTLILGGQAWADPVELTIAEEGKALQPVVVGPEASERTRAAAADLAEYLGRISGATFEVRTGEGTSGLAVGTIEDFSDLDHGGTFEPNQPFRQDDYLLRTHEDGAYLIGASEAAVHLAVWDVLHRLGYRLYFLTDTWEIVPERPSLSVAVDVMERPDYVTRRAPRGGPWGDTELWNRWRQRNRVNSSFSLDTGHSYGRIMSHNQEAFDAHPEYFALVDGERQTDDRTPKFCISNEGLRQLIVDHAVRQMKANPEQGSISMDPSDGGGWCECDQCAALGSVSDQALTLANEVAEAISNLGPRYVGMYAYNQHSPPPNIEVHPNVIISVATSFIRGGYTIEELVEGWRAKGATLGIRDYHDVFTWSHDLPRRARGGMIHYLTRTIPYFYEQGARFMNSENSDSWGANGLGYWLTPRLLWDVEAADRVDALIEDFLVNAFGEAKEPMRKFYHLINEETSVHSSEDVVARMYRHLDEARQLTSDPKVQARLNDLILYTRYVELYYDYSLAEGKARQAAFEQVWRHAYRMRDRMMMLTVAICDRGRHYRDKSVTVPDEALWSVPEAENPWKSSRPFDEAELAAIVKAGIAANEPTVLDFEAVAYSEDLVPATRLDLPEVAPGRHADIYRGQHRVYTWLPEGREQIELQITGGLIAHYRDRGNVKISLHADKEVTLEAVARDESVPPDGEVRTIVLSTPHDGLHIMEWSDGRDMTRVTWPEDLPFTIRSTLEEPMRLMSRWDLYFYVPRGTKVIGGYATTTRGRMLDGQGNAVFDFGSMDQAGYFSVDVPEGRDGTLWKFEGVTGDRMLMTVPPYLAMSDEDLLLPREVVEADAAR